MARKKSLRSNSHTLFFLTKKKEKLMTMGSRRRRTIFIIWPNVKEFTPLRLQLEFEAINQSC